MGGTERLFLASGGGISLISLIGRRAAPLVYAALLERPMEPSTVDRIGFVGAGTFTRTDTFVRIDSNRLPCGYRTLL